MSRALCADFTNLLNNKFFKIIYKAVLHGDERKNDRKSYLLSTIDSFVSLFTLTAFHRPKFVDVAGRTES